MNEILGRRGFLSMLSITPAILTIDRKTTQFYQLI